MATCNDRQKIPFCFGYITGIIDGYLTLATVKGLSQNKGFCVGESVKLPAAVAAVVAFIRSNVGPSSTVSASEEVLVAPYTKFPCS
ncbi:Rap1a/Tai family immunity protein [Mesorhizobium sp. AR07]|uniref:Rap1a/Tai family immunity protein n=1 Tax=Mesorhizobium sp. AR07 TaxID=2865838 RepID=UPI0039B6EB2C